VFPHRQSQFFALDVNAPVGVNHNGHSITGCSSSTDFFACIQSTWWPERYDFQDWSMARISL